MNEILEEESGNPELSFTHELSWDRFVYVNSCIDTALVQNLASEILRFKRQSNQAITVGIDSPGGSLSSLNSLIGLLLSPDQDGHTCPLHTVAINRAQSAAATLLAFGEYAVAFRHSQILYHPVSLSASTNTQLTAASSISVARDLQVEDETFALSLAGRIIKRLVWVYCYHKLNGFFQRVRELYPGKSEEFRDAFKDILLLRGCDDLVIYDFDLSGFVLMLWAQLSYPTDKQVIQQAVDDLLDVVQAGSLVEYLQQGSSVPSNPDQPYQSPLHSQLKSAFETAQKLLHQISSEESSSKNLVDDKLNELERLIAIYLRHAVDERGGLTISQLLPELAKETELLKSLGQSDDQISTSWLMNNALHMLLSAEAIDHFNKSSADEKADIRQRILRPQCEIFWLFTAMFCRRLFALENNLTPEEAQLLGLVDEVLGGGFPSQSKFEYDSSRSRNTILHESDGDV